MLTCVYLSLLAQAPQGELYFHPLKLVVLLVLFVVWAFFAQWTDKDTVRVNTYRELWNMVVMGGGIGGLLLGLFVPNFLIAAPLMFATYLAVMLAYVVHRNALVKPEDTVGTMTHFQRLREEGLFSRKKKVKEVRERVRLTGADKKWVAIPEDEILREQYRLVQDLVFDVFWRRAALVELTPAGESTRVTYLIDGIPTEREGLPRAAGDAVLTFLKRVAGLNVEELRKPQRGRITAALGENRHPITVETAGSTAGERLRLRVLGLEGRGKVQDLGFTPKQLETIRGAMERPRGLVLVTGPRASGLTTTIYSLTRSHDAFLQNIQMLEFDRPVEVDNVTQRLFVPGDDRTFHSEMQKMVRSDPDMLFFPEIRDQESAALACQGAAEKIRVYVGLSAEDVFDALRKWTALVGDKALVAKSLWLITSQRLVRKLCSECKQPYKPDPAMLKRLNLPAEAVLYRQPEPQYDKHGNPILCQACQGTSYVGRTAVFDLLPVDEELRQVIRAAANLGEVQAFVLKRGGTGFQTAAMQKVLDGTTSIQEVARVLRGPGQGAPRPAAVPQPQPQPRPQPKPPAGRGGA